MPPFFKTLSGYFLTSTSILGAAVATPTFLGAITGAITWREAALPLLGAAISFALPQKLSPASANQIVTAVGALGTQVAPVLEQSPNPIVRDVGLVLPAVTDELEHAFANYQAAQARLNTAKATASQQASKLTASLAKTTQAGQTGPIVPVVAGQMFGVGTLAAKTMSPVDAALLGQGAAYDPVASQPYTPAT